jgi:hypothetical protein
MLRFTAGERSVVVVVTSHPRTVSLTMTLAPPASVGIDVRPLHGVVRRVWSDEGGTAECRSLPPGPMSLLVHWPMPVGGPVRTPWTQV